MWSIERDSCAMIGCGHMVGNISESVGQVFLVDDGIAWHQVKAVTVGSRRGGFRIGAGGSHVGWVGIV